MRASCRTIVSITVGALTMLLVGCGGVHRSDGDRLTDAIGSGGLGEDEAVMLLSDAEVQRAALPDEPYWPYRIAWVHEARGRSREATFAAGDALRLDPTYEPALLLLSKLYFEEGRHQEAIDLLGDARAASAGSSSRLAAALALHYDAIEAWEDADALVDSLHDPRQSADVGSALAYVALKGEDVARGAAHAEAALAANDDSAINLNNYAVSRLRAGDPVAARKAFLEAIDRDPSLASPYYNLAVTEQFFFLDRVRAAAWFDEYRERADHDAPADLFDPDGLVGILGADARDRLASADADDAGMSERTTP